MVHRMENGCESSKKGLGKKAVFDRFEKYHFEGWKESDRMREYLHVIMRGAEIQKEKIRIWIDAEEGITFELD